jgi:hypothetical protein
VVHNYNPRLRQKDPKFHSRLGYTARPYFKKNKTKLPSTVAHAYNPTYSEGRDQDIQVHPRGKTQDPMQKITKAKSAGGIVQVADHLLSKHKVEFKLQYCQK